ncbi:hypothetical protein [Moorena producens]|uniref:hypothetical protein n=1 Tax=Moorena producens TaxID=1155739 RepID=UPI0011EA6F7D|nr:hypothetical protein [Moorena producens]
MFYLSIQLFAGHPLAFSLSDRKLQLYSFCIVFSKLETLQTPLPAPEPPCTLADSIYKLDASQLSHYPRIDTR